MSVRKTRKLLTAAVGVATVSYVVGCGRTATGFDDEGRQLNGDESSGDELGTDGTGLDVTRSSGARTAESSTFDHGEQTVISGNLVAPPPATSGPSPDDSAIISGNLIAPPDLTNPPDSTAVVDTTWEVTSESSGSSTSPDFSSLIAGNLLPPPSASPGVSTEPPASTDNASTKAPPTSSEVSQTTEATLDLPDAQAPLVDASVTDGESSQ